VVECFKSKGGIMDNRNKTIFVSGVTGKQGSAVVSNLIKEGWKVIGLTRSLSHIKDTIFKKDEVQFVEGDLNDVNSFKNYLSGVYGVFSVQNFWEHGYDSEVKQGKNLANAAKDAGVKHFVYNSVGSATRDTGLAHFESKRVIEEYIRKINLPYTIFRPAYFMENFLFNRDQILEGQLVSALEPDISLQMIAVKDIGKFVAAAFSEPDVFISKEIELAGDALTFPDVASIMSRVLGKPVEYVRLDINAYEEIAGKEYALMVNWFNKVGYNVDIDALRTNYDIELTTFEEWMQQTNLEPEKVKQYK
jgi:uncharacterized protein YbjT (DUF2867 family)